MYHLSSILLLIFPLSVLAIDKGCLLSKYEKYAEAQKKWQKGLTELTIDNAPELKEVANLYLGDQLLLIQKRFIAVTLLLDDSPEKLKTDQKVKFWLQLEASDENKLVEDNNAYNQIFTKNKINASRKPHKHNNKLRELIRTQIVPSKDFKALYSNFTAQIKAINNIMCAVL